MKKLILSLTIVLLSTSLYAQISSSIKGLVIDTAYTTKLANASVSILNEKDSTLVKFTRVNTSGAFSMSGFKKGSYILMVTYPGYADYVDRFKLDSVPTEKDFGRINLTLKATLLANVIIKGTAGAIKIKGDTTEYNASAFTIQPNSKVDDLLKQLPGIQIDKDGKITAQGQAVNKVLVDGEEFFGDDPTLVTKNLRGDMVDKVQVYDKKSDQATFTGIDDGQKSKTINIKLKEDKKNGYFGKIDAGIATRKIYEGQAMFNIFKAKQKFSAYGTIGNTGKTGLGWQDNSKYGASDNMEFSDDGSIMFFSSGEDELESFGGNYNGEGIPLARNGGVHYNNKWNSDKQSINANYKIGSLTVDGTKNVQSQNNLPSGLIKSLSDESFHNYAFRQKADAVYEIKLDTTSTLKVSVEGTLKNNKTDTRYLTSSLNGNDQLLNTSDRNVNNETDQKIFKATAFYNKRYKKKGRSISLNVSESVNQSDTKGYLKSTNSFYKSNLLDSTKVIDQYKTNAIKSTVLTSNLTYSEPFTPRFSLVLNYGFGLNNSTQDRRSFNANEAGRYTLLDTLFSNEYKLDQTTNQIGAIFNYKGEKSIVNFGSRVTAVNFKQLDEYTGIKLNRNFINWSPQASYQYKFSQQKSLRLSYNGNTNQPSINQIQPVRVNTDPLNISVGNPNLRPSFNNNINLSFNSYKILTSRSIWINGSYNFVLNPIVSNTTTDSAGRSTFQSINLRNKNTSNFYMYAYYDKKIKALDLNIGGNINANGNTYYNYSNNVLNTTKSYSYTAGLNLSKNKEKKYAFYLNFGPSYNLSESSLQKNISNNGWGMTGGSSITIFLPAKLEFGTEASYEYRGKTQTFNENFQRLLLDARVTRKFLKKEEVRLSLSVKDLLNQNSGFDRSAYGNIISQTNYTTIRRYFMASLSWDFNKMGGATTQK
jgi:outer membrane receptor protein involved in Fe transport